MLGARQIQLGRGFCPSPFPKEFIIECKDTGSLQSHAHVQLEK